MTSLKQRLFKKREKGATLVLFTFLSVFVVMPFIGLAVDGAVVYLMKAKLSSAVDAAALATARTPTLDTTVGQTYFSANFPAGTFGSTVIDSTITPSSDPQTKTLKASVQASILVPLYFLRLIGYPNATVRATGTASRRISNVILVVDRSGSLQLSGSCPSLISSAINFTNDFVDGRDTLGLITFQATANVDFPPATNFKMASPNLTSTLSQLACAGYTNTSEALHLALTEIQQISQSQPYALNAIVLFTDGWADSFTGTFTSQPPSPSLPQIKTLADQRYTYSSPYSPVSVPASTCRATPLLSGPADVLTGVLIDIDGATDAQGYVAGLFQDLHESISYQGVYNPVIGSFYGSAYGWATALPRQTIATPAGSSGNCAFNDPSGYGAYPSDSYYVSRDIAYLPSQDAFGNSLTGHWAPNPFTSSSYLGLQHPDTPVGVMNAAQNAADYQANVIRNDASQPVIYTIGLGSSVNVDLLQRIANDPISSSYNSAQQQGKYYPATTAGLNAVFQQVASQILRLSK